MSDKQVIDAKIQAAAMRRKLLLSWQCMWRGLLVGVCIWLSALVVFKVVPISHDTLIWSGFVGLSLPVGGLIYGLVRRFATSDTARWLDLKTGSKERLGTAVELADVEAAHADWSDLVLRDAALAARQIEPRKLLPIRVPRIGHWILLALVACVGLGFVPEHRSQAYLDQQRDVVIIKDVGRNLEVLTQLQVAMHPPHFESTKNSLESVQEFGQELTRGELVRDKVLAKLSSLAEQLRDQSRTLGQAHTLRKLQQFANSSPKTAQQSITSIQRQLDAIKQSLGDAENTRPEQYDSLKSKMDAIKKAVAGLPNANSPERQQARQQLAQSMADLSRKAEQMGLELPKIEEALQALESSDIDQFLKNMSFAGEDLQKMADLTETMRNLQMQMAEFGKTLGEQLEKGQVPAALQSLQKMIAKLDSTQLTPEQLEQMIQELQEACEPAKNFGDCSNCLSSAWSKAKAGEKARASKALAEAVEELKNALQQMDDVQNMIACLQNVERAQLAVGNCQTFGSSKKPGAGPSKKLGGDVGTWGNDRYQLTSNDLAQRWDNSGFSRPNMDARGNTDRGGSIVPDDLVSSRIKGKVKPSGPMPSITLRGVSITGNSNVQFQEAVTAAQSDARNALNQDKVPQAYRNSVRDYFDDLKQ